MTGIRVRSEWHGNRILGRLGPVRRTALRRGGHKWFARTQQVVPLREGHLQRSGKLEINGDSVQIVYGTVYGMVQHERLDYRHSPGRRAKYITSVADPDDLRLTIAAELRRLFR